MRILTLFTVLAFMMPLITRAQTEVNYFKGMKQTTEFDFFTGDKASDFKTTFKGFGSLANSLEKTLISVDNKYVSLFAGIGYSIRYYRFAENIQFTRTNDALTYVIEKDPDYEFKNSFFSWSKNKMVIGYLLVPVGFDIKSKYADLRLAFTYTRYLAGKHKTKYNDPDQEVENRGTVFFGFMMNDEKEKIKIPNKDFRDFYINKNNFTVSFDIIPKKEGKRLFGIGFRYGIQPLFQTGKGPDLHEVAIVLSQL